MFIRLLSHLPYTPSIRVSAQYLLCTLWSYLNQNSAFISASLVRALLSAQLFPQGLAFISLVQKDAQYPPQTCPLLPKNCQDIIMHLTPWIIPSLRKRLPCSDPPSDSHTLMKAEMSIKIAKSANIGGLDCQPLPLEDCLQPGQTLSLQVPGSLLFFNQTALREPCPQNLWKGIHILRTRNTLVDTVKVQCCYRRSHL